MNRLRRVMLFVSLFAVLPLSTHGVDRTDGKQDTEMETYIIFFSFTAQGIEKVKESPQRVDAAKKTVESMGGRMKAFYGILGSEFDTLFIVEAPDDKTVAKMVLTIAEGGNVRTRTHRLFTEEQYREIMSSLP